MSQLKDFYNSLNDDVKGKLKACKSQEEMMKVLDDANIELSPELLTAVNGGAFDCVNNTVPDVPTIRPGCQLQYQTNCPFADDSDPLICKTQSCE